MLMMATFMAEKRGTEMGKKPAHAVSGSKGPPPLNLGLKIFLPAMGLDDQLLGAPIRVSIKNSSVPAALDRGDGRHLREPPPAAIPVYPGDSFEALMRVMAMREGDG